MFELHYSSDLRLRELVSLNCMELNLNEGRGEVRVSHGKGDNVRVVPVSSVTRTALTDWLKRRADYQHLAAVYDKAHPRAMRQK